MAGTRRKSDFRSANYDRREPRSTIKRICVTDLRTLLRYYGELGQLLSHVPASFVGFCRQAVHTQCSLISDVVADNITEARVSLDFSDYFLCAEWNKNFFPAMHFCEI